MSILLGDLLERIRSKQTRVGIIGLGYVGLPLAVEFARAGCHEMDINVREVIDAAKTKPFGFMPFYPGPGLGGHCIPIDPFYPSWKARPNGFESRFIELAGHVNAIVPRFVVTRIADALNMAAIDASAALAQGFDCAVITTHHRVFDYEEIVRRSPLVVDTRNAVKIAAPNVFRL